jgi:hypothetical protein
MNPKLRCRWSKKIQIKPDICAPKNHMNFKREKLTKSFLFSLPAGCFIASNPLKSDQTPMYAAAVVGLREREQQWKEMSVARVTHRLCNVFDSKQDFLNSRLGKSTRNLSN